MLYYPNWATQVNKIKDCQRLLTVRSSETSVQWSLQKAPSEKSYKLFTTRTKRIDKQLAIKNKGNQN